MRADRLRHHEPEGGAARPIAGKPLPTRRNPPPPSKARCGRHRRALRQL